MVTNDAGAAFLEAMAEQFCRQQGLTPAVVLFLDQGGQVHVVGSDVLDPPEIRIILEAAFKTTGHEPEHFTVDRSGNMATEDGPQELPPEQIVTMLLKVIGDKAPVRDVEFGMDLDDPLKWWAKAMLRSGRLRAVEVKVEDARLGAVEALAELGRELGLSIRIRDVVTGE